MSANEDTSLHIVTSSVTRADLLKLPPCIVFGVGYRLNLKQFDMLAEQYLTAEEMKELSSPMFVSRRMEEQNADQCVYAYNEDDGSLCYFWVVGGYPGFKGRKVPRITVPPLLVEYFFPGREAEFGTPEGKLMMWPPHFERPDWLIRTMESITMKLLAVYKQREAEYKAKTQRPEPAAAASTS
ncbi:hypothetical protein CYLTODRAFT_444444 [Cylindrobasidium torrendii FP15055 ss-10]|uniref:Uncharacterized protein n=1 Tax=Cylindrobasidium torrendii FP15055 ss-10 TaxID=1314674 RepID=A0A0D7BBE4_9AGAR|nr:hypothetical protein CYLTODRAFT_444444 [Cylindrobasidium torrendii FP15055 ss-10]